MREGAASLNVTPNRSTPITIASLLFLLSGLVFAILEPLVLAYTICYRSAPVLLGIQTPDADSKIGLLGGLDAVIALSFVFLTGAIIDVVAGSCLWRALKKGGK